MSRWRPVIRSMPAPWMNGGAANSAGLLALVKDEPWLGDGQRVKRTLTQIHGAFCKPSMRVGAYKGAAVVVPAQIVAQHLEGLHTRDPF